MREQGRSIEFESFRFKYSKDVADSDQHPARDSLIVEGLFYQIINLWSFVELRCWEPILRRSRGRLKQRRVGRVDLSAQTKSHEKEDGTLDRTCQALKRFRRVNFFDFPQDNTPQLNSTLLKIILYNINSPFSHTELAYVTIAKRH